MIAPEIDLARYQEIVVLTGAGISVASGLPTYRGPGGLWDEVAVERYATAHAVESDPCRVWAFTNQLRAKISAAAPNPAHFALAQTERRLGDGQRLTVLTQNVDGLHTLAGSQRVVELHGSLRASRCTRCDFSRQEDLCALPECAPACPACTAPLRPSVVFFDEPLPLAAEWEAKKVLRTCDLFIAVGTSGVVSPASNYVRAAEYVGARTVYVNLAPMKPHNPAFRETHLGRAEELLPRLLGCAAPGDQPSFAPAGLLKNPWGTEGT